MKSFKQYLIEEKESEDDSVDLHLAGHFGSGKSTALKKANIAGQVSVIDLDDLDQELSTQYGKKPSDEESLKKWHENYDTLYRDTVRRKKKIGKPIVVVGHHWENGSRFAPVNARKKIYIDISKEKLFSQRKDRDKGNPYLTDEYLNREYAQVQGELDKENYEKLPFGEVVKNLSNLGR